MVYRIRRERGKRLKSVYSGLIVCVLAGSAVAQTSTPTISGIAPASGAAGDSNIVITVNGTGFSGSTTASWTAGSVVTPLATTFITSGQLTVTIPQTLVNSPTT